MHHTINAAVTKRHEAAHAQINLRQKGTRSMHSFCERLSNVYLKTIEIYQQHESSYNTCKRNEHHSQAKKKTYFNVKPTSKKAQ